MKTVREEMLSLIQQKFVGRETELKQLKSAVTQSKWTMLHVYGHSGIGKTALLQEFARSLTANTCYMVHLQYVTTTGRLSDFTASVESIDPNCSYIPGNSLGRPIPLERLYDQITSIAASDQPITLLFDSFDDWKPLHAWLRDHIIARLPVSVRVITSGRLPIDSTWLYRDGWSHVITQIQLPPLSQGISQNIIESSDIDSIQTIRFIERFARGIPFVLLRLCEDTKAKGIQHIRSDPYQTSLIDNVARQIKLGLTLDEQEHDLLDAISLMWNFDEDLIRYLVNDELLQNKFQRFIQLPVMERTPFGWRMIPSVRYWLKKEFARRAPKRYADHVNRLKRYWTERLDAANDERKRTIGLHLLHLAESDSLHMHCFGAHQSLDHYEIGPIKNEELAEVGRLKSSIGHEGVPEEKISLREIEDLRRLSPETFYGFRREGRLSMVMSLLPLHEAVHQQIIEHPKFDVQANDMIIAMAAFYTEAGTEAFCQLLLYGCSHVVNQGRLIVITPSMEAQSVLEEMGFERLEWDDLTEDKAYRLDLTDLSALKQMKAIPTEFDPLPEKSLTVLSRKEAIAHVKNLLMYFSHFEQKPEVYEYCPYLKTLCHSREELAEGAETIRKFIISVLDAWTKRNEEHALFGEILRLFYIQKAGTHETIAMRLNLSVSTYYRYSRKAVASLADTFLMHLEITNS